MESNKPQNADFNHVIGLISNAQNKVFTVINQELVLLNWEIGKYLSQKVNSGDWGDGVVV